MKHRIDLDHDLATELMLVLNESFPEATYGAIPVIDQYDALEAYRAYDDGALAEAPQALAAYVTHQEHFAN